MEGREELNPSPELFENKSIYNFFKLLPNVTREEAFKYLNQLYQAHVKETQTSPISTENQLRELLNLAKKYDWLLIYKMVEIKKMLDEEGFLEFEERENGCLTAFFKGYCETLIHDNGPITDEYIQKLHAACTKKVHFEEMYESECGEYRKEDFECLIQNLDETSLSGIAYFIQSIGNGPLSGMMICSSTECEKYVKLLKDKNNREKEVKMKALAVDLAQEIYLNIKKEDFLKSWDEFLDKNFSDPEMENRILDLIGHILSDKLYISDYENVAKSIGLAVPKDIEFLLLKCRTNLFDEDPSAYLNALKIIASDEVLIKIFGKAIETLESLKNEEIINFNSSKVEFENFQKIMTSQHSLDKLTKPISIQSSTDLAKVFLNRLKTKYKPQDLALIFPKDPSIITLYIKELNDKLDAQTKKSVQEKLEFIYHYIQLFLLIHPFVDANNRTFLNQLALELHRRLNLVEPIFFNPFFPYGLSPEENVEVAKLSCALSLAVKEFALTGKSLFFDFMKPTHRKEVLLAEKIAQQVIHTIELMLAKNYLSTLSNKTVSKSSTLFSEISPFKVDINLIMEKAESVEEILKSLELLENKYINEPKLNSLCKEAREKIASDFGLDKKEEHQEKPVPKNS